MKKLKPINITNTIIKLFFFFAFPAAWATGFSGVKYLCEQIHSGKPIEMKAFLVAFIALAAFTIVFGRFFCGRACAFGTYGDILHELARIISKKTKRKLPKISGKAASNMRHIKYAVLLAVCLMCMFGYSSVVSGASPWTAFSHLRSGRLEFSSKLDIIGIALFALISVCMLIYERFFCRFLCPFGAVFSLLPVLPISTVSRDKSRCLRCCKACQNVCPAGLELPYYPVPTEAEFAESLSDKPALSRKAKASESATANSNSGAAAANVPTSSTASHTGASNTTSAAAAPATTAVTDAAATGSAIPQTDATSTIGAAAAPAKTGTTTGASANTAPSAAAPAKADEIAKAYQEFLYEQQTRAACMGECFQCGRCIHIKKALQCSCNKDCGTMKPGTRGIIIDICKAAVLAAILYKVI